ncbi:MAG: nucleotide exchange factor GrpE [Bacillota bacterium]|nr:nucleotide exchange factor GrpE [Bacillota bacterium]
MTKKKETNEEIKESEDEIIEEVSGAEAEEIESNTYEAKNAELTDKLLRITAEYDNFRKRTEREKSQIYETVKADTASKFLPLFDNIEKAVSSKPDNSEGNWKAFSEGLDLIRKQMVDVLDGLEIEAIDAVGQTFNPELHNAVMHIQDDSLGENVVSEEFLKGFKIKDRVLRHSVVKVAN